MRNQSYEAAEIHEDRRETNADDGYGQEEDQISGFTREPAPIPRNGIHGLDARSDDERGQQNTPYDGENDGCERHKPTCSRETEKRD